MDWSVFSYYDVTVEKFDEFAAELHVYDQCQRGCIALIVFVILLLYFVALIDIAQMIRARLTARHNRVTPENKVD